MPAEPRSLSRRVRQTSVRDRAAYISFIAAILIITVVQGYSEKNKFIEFTARRRAVPEILKAVFRFMPHSKYIVVRDLTINKQERFTAFGIRQIVSRNGFRYFSFRLWGNRCWPRLRPHRVSEAIRYPIFVEKRIYAGNRVPSYRLPRVSESHSDQDWSIWRSRYASAHLGTENVGLFRIDKSSLTHHQSVLGDSILTDSYNGINDGEHSYDKGEFFRRFPIEPKTLLGLVCLGLVPVFVAKAVVRGGSPIFLVLAFVVAHLAAFLLGLYTTY